MVFSKTALAEDYPTFLGALKFYLRFYPLGSRPILLECNADPEKLAKFYRDDYLQFFAEARFLPQLLQPCSVTLFKIKLMPSDRSWNYLNVYQPRQLGNEFYTFSTRKDIDEKFALLDSAHFDHYFTLAAYLRIAPPVASYAYIRAIQQVMKAQNTPFHRFIIEQLLSWTVQSDANFGITNHFTDFHANWKMMTDCYDMLNSRNQERAADIAKIFPPSVICAVTNCPPLSLIRHSQKPLTQLDLLAAFWDDVKNLNFDPERITKEAMQQKVERVFETVRGKKFEGSFVDALQAIAHGIQETLGANLFFGIPEELKKAHTETIG